MIKKIIITAFVFTAFLSADFVKGQGFNASGGKSFAMGGASVTNSDLWSAFNNQAGLADIRSIKAGIIYENRFLLKELGNKAGVVAIPIDKGTFALSVSQFGFSLYNQNKVGLAYAMPLSKNLSAGVQFDYLLTHLGENYGSKGLFTFEIGLMAKLSEKMYMGAHVYNPLRVKLTSDVEERIPSTIRFGLKYVFSDKVNVAGEVEKDINYDAIFKAGVEYEMVKNIFVRCGIANNPSLFSFGFGVHLGSFDIDFGTSKHNALGYSPALSLMYDFNKD